MVLALAGDSTITRCFGMAARSVAPGPARSVARVEGPSCVAVTRPEGPRGDVVEARLDVADALEEVLVDLEVDVDLAVLSRLVGRAERDREQGFRVVPLRLDDLARGGRRRTTAERPG